MFDRQLRPWLICSFLATCVAAAFLATAQTPLSQSSSFAGVLAGLSMFLLVLRLGL